MGKTGYTRIHGRCTRNRPAGMGWSGIPAGMGRPAHLYCIAYLFI